VRSPSGPKRCHAGRHQDSGRSPATARSGVRAEHAKPTPLFSSRTSPLSPSHASLLLALRRLCRTPPPPWELALQCRCRRFAAVAALQGKPTPPAAPRRRAAPPQPLPVAGPTPECRACLEAEPPAANTVGRPFSKSGASCPSPLEVSTRVRPNHSPLRFPYIPEHLAA
jgi:hypothetical protein